jgi:hypothetical protein
MAVKVVHISDLTGAEADEAKMAKLTIRRHPGVEGLPVTLEALPEELSGLETEHEVVEYDLRLPDSDRSDRIVVPLADFQKIVTQDILTRVVISLAEQRAQEQPARRRGRPRKSDGSSRPASVGKINYASLDHAGEPHRGRITEDEKRIVREHFDEVNKRLSDKGMRMIDPADPKMKDRYGLD